VISQVEQDAIDEGNRRVIVLWKEQLSDPDCPGDMRIMLQNLIASLEKNLDYTYTEVKLPYSIRVVKHLRNEPRPLAWEEERLIWPLRMWKKFTIWFDWWWNK
jgi:hypothetical protein